MTDSIRRILRPFVFAACLSPAAFMLWDMSRNLNANPFNAVVRSTGFWSLRFRLGLRSFPLGGRFGAFRFAFSLFLTDTAAAEHVLRRMFLHDLVLKSHQSIDQCLGARRTPGYVNIDRHYAIDSLQSRISRKRPASRSARAHRNAPLRLGHLIPNAFDYWRHL